MKPSIHRRLEALEGPVNDSEIADGVGSRIPVMTAAAVRRIMKVIEKRGGSTLPVIHEPPEDSWHPASPDR